MARVMRLYGNPPIPRFSLLNVNSTLAFLRMGNIWLDSSDPIKCSCMEKFTKNPKVPLSPLIDTFRSDLYQVCRL